MAEVARPPTHQSAAHHQRHLRATADMVYSRESSPDPLITTPDASNIIASSPIRAGSAVQVFKSSRPLRESSPNIRSPSPVKQQRTIIFSTPTKSSRRDSVANSSPWRIKVTVEAEPGSGERSGQRTRTTTIKVPLKGEDEHVPLKRKRTPRKSAEGAQVGAGSKTSARKGTPRKRKSAGAGDVLEENTAQADANGANAENTTPREPAKRPRGRPRKSLDPIVKLSTPVKPAARRSTRNLFADVTPLHEKEAFDVRANMPPVVEQEWVPDQKIANRVPTPARPATSRTQIPAVSSEAEQAEEQPSLRGGSTVQTYDGNSEAEACVEESAVEDTEQDLDGRTFSPSDDTIALDRSLAESEGFTMISLESLRSRHDILVDHPDASTREPQTGSSPAQDQGEPASGTVSPPQASIEAEEAPPVAEEEENLAPAEHSAHVSIPPPSVAIETRESPQELVEEPLDESQQDAQPRGMAKKRKSGDSNIFLGFRTGTKRQLRANFAMGELLARSEPGFGALAASRESRKQADEEQDAMRQTIARLPTPADTAEMSSSPPVAASTTKRRQIASPGELPLEIAEMGNRSYDEMSWEPTQAREHYHEMSRNSGLPVPHHAHDGKEKRREILESPELSLDQPSLERNTSKPKESEANQHQNEGEDGQFSNTGSSNPRPRTETTSKRKRGETLDVTEDLWLGEANSSLEDSMASQASRARKPAKKPQEPPLDFRELFGEDDRPQRGKLPRTWRRESGNHFLYSDENPSPVQAVSKSIFERDLENLSELQDREHVVPTIERSPTPLRGILSSPLGRSVSHSPKAVSFGGDDVREFESEVDPNEQYYSSEDSGSSSASDGEDATPGILTAEEDMDATFFEQGTQDIGHAESSSFLEASDVRQIRREMALPSQASMVPKVPSTDLSSSRAAQDSSILRPNPQKQYALLFPTLTGSSAKHPTRQSLATPRKPTPTSAQPTQGIFARLSSWLYPPPPPQRTWNRNHFYVLEHHWKASFPTPQHVLADARATQSLPATETTSARDEDTSQEQDQQQARLAHLPHDLRIYAGVTLHVPRTRTSTPTTPPPLTLTPTHLHITHAFIREAADRGIPLLSDGCLTRRRPSADFPKRDARGRVVRVRELWQCWDVLCFLYGLWGRDVMAALEEVGDGV